MNKPTLESVTADLVAEQAALDAVVAPLAGEAWELATPSPRWAVRDQIGHLAYFDQTATLAINDPDGFSAHRREFLEIVAGSARAGVAGTAGSARAADEFTLGAARAMSAAELLDHWRKCRSELAAAAADCAEGSRIEWYGPSMGAKSFLTARLMECWAHGQDVCDTVGGIRTPTGRLRHVAQLGVITRGWTYANRKLDIPDGDVRVAVVAPSGDNWVWGPVGAAGSVVGPALDFCLVTTQRRNVADTSLVVTGDIAVDWMNMAQLFAGPPSRPPAPRG